MREIRTLRVMWRELEMGLRPYLAVTAPVPDPTSMDAGGYRTCWRTRSVSSS